MSVDLQPLQGRPVIVGGGVAGLMTALALAPEPVVLLTKAPLGTEASSPLAQGGMAASLGADDTTEFHLADTLAAGDGLCDTAAARRIIEAAPGAIERLARLGVDFDRGPEGAFRLGLEAAHSRRRIVHASGDATGRELMRALAAAVSRTPSITVLEGMEARRLLLGEDGIAGVLAVGHAGALALSSGRVVLATGGIGGLFRDTTNPLSSFGQGLALAANAGAQLADMEFVQFHPTALDVGTGRLPLISEAVRGEGAVLVDEHGRRFLADTPGAELAPRDVVARAVWRERAAGRRVFLDARACGSKDIAARFPGIATICREAGIDIQTDPIPVRPAVHYHMGGVAVDAEGRSSVRGLWACGEVARTGLHGANRLASNSLTEAVVTAGCVAASVAATPANTDRRLLPVVVPPQPDASALRHCVSEALGIVRDGETLRGAAASLLSFALSQGATADPARVTLMMVVAALQRQESRGSHCRDDFAGKQTDARASRLTLAQAIEAAATLTDIVPPRAARG